jgi:hypothetical protein
MGGGARVMGDHGHGVSMKARTAGWCVSRFFRQPVDHSLNAVLGIVRQDGKFKEGKKKFIKKY